MSRLTLALDVMGGDIGPRVIIPAAQQVLEKDPHLSLLLLGSENQIKPHLSSFSSSLIKRINIQHTDCDIQNTDNIRQALRLAHQSSMGLALQAVHQGEAEGCVSAGNTGALLGLAQRIIQPIPTIERPALMSFVPTINGKIQLMLDLGANIECQSQHLFQFALMGNIFAQHYLGISKPRIALLNIGTEEHKGTQVIRETAKLLNQYSLCHYVGFLESNRLLNGDADVIVQDGFSGNIALKALEGAVENLSYLLKMPDNHQKNVFLSLFRLMKQPLNHYLKQKLHLFQVEQYNGASLLGLKAVVVKSHGRANQRAFANAISVAAKQVRAKVPQHIQQHLAQEASIKLMRE